MNYSFNVEIWEDEEGGHSFGVSQNVDGEEQFLAGGTRMEILEATQAIAEIISYVF